MQHELRSPKTSNYSNSTGFLQCRRLKKITVETLRPQTTHGTSGDKAHNFKRTTSSTDTICAPSLTTWNVQSLSRGRPQLARALDERRRGSPGLSRAASRAAIALYRSTSSAALQTAPVSPPACVGGARIEAHGRRRCESNA